jgi:hypothetical protein
MFRRTLHSYWARATAKCAASRTVARLWPGPANFPFKKTVTLIFEIAAGIVLGVGLLFIGALFIAWVASWSDREKLLAALLVVLLIVVAYKEIFPDKKVPQRVDASSESTASAPLESRAHFAARYKKANPETAKVPDEELVKRVLHDYPEWCSKLEGGCQ